jgi:DNA-binding NarL/FixJ family response regulator
MAQAGRVAGSAEAARPGHPALAGAGHSALTAAGSPALARAGPSALAGAGSPAFAGAGPSALSGPEVELLRLLGQGLLCDAVARRLHTSERTVRRRTKAICDRLEVTASIEAVVWAAHRGLI